MDGDCAAFRGNLRFPRGERTPTASSTRRRGQMAQAAPPPRPTEPLDHAVPFSAPRSPTKARRLSPAMIVSENTGFDETILPSFYLLCSLLYTVDSCTTTCNVQYGHQQPLLQRLSVSILYQGGRELYNCTGRVHSGLENFERREQHRAEFGFMGDVWSHACTPCFGTGLLLDSSPTLWVRCGIEVEDAAEWIQPALALNLLLGDLLPSDAICISQIAS